MNCKIKVLKSFERFQPNEDYKSVISVEDIINEDGSSIKNGNNLLFIRVSNYKRNYKGKLWKETESMVFDFERDSIKELANFLIECSAF